MITQAILKTLLTYNPETGDFHWLRDKGTARALELAGHITTIGYRIIKVDQKKHMAHRLAWLYMTGDFPPELIDHINRDKSDNRWANLREATHKQNHENNGKDMRGIRWEPDRGRWLVRIKHHGVSKNLGRFLELDDAISARRAAEKIHFTHSPA